jgi:hypothetical protein
MGFRSAFNGVRAALAAHPSQARKGVSVETRVIEPTSVLALIAEICKANDDHAGIVESQAAANAHADVLTAEIGRLNCSIAAQETALAVSGAPLPADPFPEEAQISLLQRELRVVKARVRVLAESAEANQNALSELRKTLRGAWHEFAVATCKEQRARFREAGLLLRSLYAEQMACLIAFGYPPGIPRDGVAVVQDPEYLRPTPTPPFTTTATELVDSSCMSAKPFWEKLAGARYEELSALRVEVEKAGGGGR